ncbi:MAG: endonuclease III [Actinobacteria bacterium]|nr:endonuclease III [Actinomycetota bacterium]
MVRSKVPDRRVRAILEELAVLYPGYARELCTLDFAGPFELLVATILSAQCTDARVNEVTPSLFHKYPDPFSMANADPGDVEAIVRSTGFYRSKADHLTKMATDLVQRFGGVVPQEVDELVTLPGVGRKTANVVRSVWFGLPGFPVDTHVLRVARRLGLSDSDRPEGVESDLDALVPASEWGVTSIRLILHGRKICSSRRPKCSSCSLEKHCPSSEA